MRLLKSCVIAFSMYSRLPMPKVEWEEENMKYAMCFFPAVGLVIGGIQMAVLSVLTEAVSWGTTFSAVLVTLLPVLLTGGIHLDGFADTVDALSSFGEKEKKLEILKDPHTGAFAVIGICCWFLAVTGIWSEFFHVSSAYGIGKTLRFSAQSSLIYVFSRSMSGLSVIMFQPAKNSGLLRTFRNSAQKGAVRNVLMIWAAASAAVLVCCDVIPGIIAAAAGALVFIYYYRMSKKQFGGITGDLAGYFLQICEPVMLAALLVSGGWLWR